MENQNFKNGDKLTHRVSGSEYLYVGPNPKDTNCSVVIGGITCFSIPTDNLEKSSEKKNKIVLYKTSTTKAWRPYDFTLMNEEQAKNIANALGAGSKIITLFDEDIS